MNRLLLASTLLLSACFVVPAQQGGSSQPAGGDPAAAGTPAASPAPAPAPGPGGPVVVSVTLRNTCPQTVKLFFGDKPKYGSGTYTTLSSNSVTSYQKQEGDMIWIVDESENGLSSTSVSQGARTIEIGPSCTGFIMR
jgi:hypothetical protein